MAEIESYSVRKSAEKAVPPVVAIAGAEILYAFLQQCGADMFTKEHCYQIALAGLAGWGTLVNWLKNRKRGK